MLANMKSLRLNERMVAENNADKTTDFAIDWLWVENGHSYSRTP